MRAIKVFPLLVLACLLFGCSNPQPTPSTIKTMPSGTVVEFQGIISAIEPTNAKTVSQVQNLVLNGVTVELDKEDLMLLDEEKRFRNLVMPEDVSVKVGDWAYIYGSARDGRVVASQIGTR